MFEKRSDLVRFLAVAEAGRIRLAAERLTPLGATVAERGRRILREFEDAETEIDAPRSGRAGIFRVSDHRPNTLTA